MTKPSGRTVSRLPLVASAVGALLLTAACGGASSTGSTSSSTPKAAASGAASTGGGVGTADTAAGTILVDSKGRKWITRAGGAGGAGGAVKIPAKPGY